MNPQAQRREGGYRYTIGHAPSIPAERPLISIIIPVLYGEGTLAIAIDSILTQRCKDLEILIIDGGSGDGTIDIVKKFENKIAYWVSEPDNGVYDAMNKGVRLAAGKWSCTLGADDELLDEFSDVERYLKDKDTVYYGNVYWPGQGYMHDGPFNEYKLAVRNICHQGIFYPRSVWKKYSYDLAHPVLADYALNLACFVDPAFKWQYIPVNVAVFNDADGLSQAGEDHNFREFKRRFVAENFPAHIAAAIAVRSSLVGLLKFLGLFRLALRARKLFLGAIKR